MLVDVDADRRQSSSLSQIQTSVASHGGVLSNHYDQNLSAHSLSTQSLSAASENMAHRGDLHLSRLGEFLDHPAIDPLFQTGDGSSVSLVHDFHVAASVRKSTYGILQGRATPRL